MNKFYLLILTVFFFSYFSKGQIVELQIDKKHSVEIKPCIGSGSTEIPKGYYETTDTIYFIMETKGDWDFSKGDLKSLQSIQIEQSGSIPNIGFKEIANSSDKIDRVLLSFENKQLVITDQFVFKVEEYTSDIMEFPENFWPYYYEFNQYYNQGKEYYEQQMYIEAFQQFQYILPGFKHTSAYMRFSNYQRTYNMLLPEVVSAYQKEQSDILQQSWSDYEENKQLSSQQLEKIKTRRESLIVSDSIFDPYFSLSDPACVNFKEQHTKLINDYNDLYQAAYVVWKKSVLSIIENGNYENENKYQVYIELLSRLLVYTNQVKKLTPYDSIDISLITKNGKSIGFLKKHIEILEKMNWKDDFISITNLINEEIKLKSTLLGATHLLNLRGNKEFESQPNYYIINGFNELVKGNFKQFKDNINYAIAKSTDLNMMYYLELWNFSYKFRIENTDDNQLESINKGLEYQKKGMPKEALENYGIAERMGSNALAPFLIGMINLKVKNEIFSAERYFNDALNIYPVFTLANIYNLKILLDSKQYDLAANKFEIVLELPELSVWYIYYLQSKLYFMQYDYEESLRIIQTKCRPLNPYFFEQYIMLGDIYLKLNNCATAKENYLNAGKLQPNNKSYSSRMQMLILQCNN